MIRGRKGCSTNMVASFVGEHAMNPTFDGRRAVASGAFEAKQAFDIEAFVARYGGATRCAFRAGERLFTQEEPSTRLFYIQEGQVQLTVVSAQGKEAILSILGAGDFCGESCLVAGRVRTGTATCIADSFIAKLNRASIIRAIRQDTAFAEFFLVRVLFRAFGLRESLLSHLFDSSEVRLARVLLRLANYGKEGREGAITRAIDQEALAQMIGTTRSRVNYFMNKFRRLGYVDYSDSIVVHGALLEDFLRKDALGSRRMAKRTAAA
jgi:CRP/FNR family transcriptional regulator, cyclic AMP receptor protein